MPSDLAACYQAQCLRHAAMRRHTFSMITPHLHDTRGPSPSVHPSSAPAAEQSKARSAPRQDDVVSANRAGALSILLDADGRYGPGGEVLEGEAAPTVTVASLAEAAAVLRHRYDLQPPPDASRAGAGAAALADAAG